MSRILRFLGILTIAVACAFLLFKTYQSYAASDGNSTPDVNSYPIITLDDHDADVSSAPSSFVFGAVSQLTSLPYKAGWAYAGHYQYSSCGGTKYIDYDGTVVDGPDRSATAYACWIYTYPGAGWSLVLNDYGGSGGRFANSCAETVSTGEYNGTNYSYGARGTWAYIDSKGGGYRYRAPCGSASPSVVTALASVPTLAGYTFDGYYIDKNYTESGKVINADGTFVYSADGLVTSGLLQTGHPTTVVAKWTATDQGNDTWYTITIDDQGASTSSQYSTLYKNVGGACDGQYRTTQSCAGEVINYFSGPSKTGYVYGGHFTGPDGTGAMWASSGGQIQTSGVNITGDTTVYAYWIPDMFIVTLNANGGTLGSGAPTTVCLHYGIGWTATQVTSAGVKCTYIPITDAGVPTRSNYSFQGFYNVASGGTQISSSGGNLLATRGALTSYTSDGTAYAHWVPTGGGIDFKSMTLRTGRVINGTVYEYQNVGWYATAATTYQIVNSIFKPVSEGGAGISVPTNGTDVFNGYWTAADGGTQVIDRDGYIVAEPTYDSNQTLYSQWIPGAQTTAITFNANGGSWGNCSEQSVNAVNGQSMPTVTCHPTRSDYDFIGYADDTESGVVFYYNRNLQSVRDWDKTASTYTLYAQWERPRYNVSYYCSESSGVAEVDTPAYLEPYTVREFTDTPCSAPSGKVFDYWQVASNGNSSLTTWQGGQGITYGYPFNVMAYAHYADAVRTITYQPNGGSPSSNQTQTVVQGTEFDTRPGTLFTKSNSVITRWDTVSGGTYPIPDHRYSYTLPADTTLKAKWGTCSCSLGNNVASCNVTGVNGNKCQYSYLCSTGYEHEGASSGTFEGTVNVSSNTSPDCSLPPTVEVGLNKNGGTGVIKNAAGETFQNSDPGTMTCTPGAAASLPTWSSAASSNNTTNITKGTGANSKVFVGWATSSTATTGTFSITCPSSNDVTYYAVWSAPTCNATNGTATVATTVDNKPTCAVTCSTGYHESGTYSGTAGSTSYNHTCNLNRFNVVYAAGTGGSGSGPTAPTSCEYGSACSAPANTYTAPTGKEFGYWACTASSGSCASDTYAAGASIAMATAVDNATITLTAVWNNRSYTCAAGKYLNASNASCADCTDGNYCPGGTWTFDGTNKGINSCTTNAGSLYTHSGTGTADNIARNDINDCYVTTTAGKYISANNTQTNCPTSFYCPSTDIFYGSTGGKLNCNTGTASGTATTPWTSAASATARASCYRSVNLNKNGGSGPIQGTVGSTSPATVTCNYNTACNFGGTNTLSQEGYAFSGGWALGTSGTCDSTTTSFTITSTDADLDYYACKQGNEITLLYSNGGHGTSPANGSCTYGSSFTAPAAITGVEGYAFNNWVINGQGYMPAASVSCTADVLGVTSGSATITATWGYNAYFRCEDTSIAPYVYSGTPNPEEINGIAHNQTITLSSVSACTHNYPDEGWIHTPGWTYTCVDDQGHTLVHAGVENGSFVWQYEGTCTFRSIASIPTYSISYSCGAGEGTAPSNDSVKYYTRDTVRPAANTGCSRTGYTFAGWKVGNTDTVLQPGQYNQNNLWPYAQNVSLSPNWQANTYQLTWGCGVHGTGTIPNNSSFPRDIDFDEVLTFPENTVCTPQTGYEFTGWAVDIAAHVYSAGYPFAWPFTSGSQINASFEPIKVNITYSCGTGASGTAPAAQNNIDYNSQVELRGLGSCTKNGYTATQWAVSGTSGPDKYDVGAIVPHWTYTENKTLTPDWQPNTYSITYMDEDGETELTGLTPTSYIYGTTTTIDAAPTRLHSVFNGWCTGFSNGAPTGCTNPNNPPVIGQTETGPKTFYASWSCEVGYSKDFRGLELDSNTVLYDATGSGQHYIVSRRGICSPIRYHIHCDGNGGVACLEQFNLGETGTVGRYHFGTSYNTKFWGNVEYIIPSLPVPVYDSGADVEDWPRDFTIMPYDDKNYGKIPYWLGSTVVNDVLQTTWLNGNYVTYMQTLAAQPYNSGIDFGRPHYAFDGLWTEPVGGQKFIGANGLSATGGLAFNTKEMSTFFTSDATVYAHWIPDIYTITLNANKGGDTSGQSGLGAVYEKYETGWATSYNGTYTQNLTLTDVQKPTRTGYTFMGWYDDATGGTQKIPASGVLPGPSTFGAGTELYAHWQANTYTVSYDCNGGTGTLANSTATYDSEFTARAVTGCTRTGYTGSDKWYIGDTNNVWTNGTTWTYTENQTFKRRWTPNVYHITLDKNNCDTAGTAGVYELYETGWSLTTGSMSNPWDTSQITVPSKPGHDFTGYYENANGTGAVYFADGNLPSEANIFTSNKALYAQCVSNTHTITFKSGDTVIGTQSCLDGQSTTLSTVAAPVSSSKGWSLHGWATSVNTTTPNYTTTVTCNGDMTLYGIWKRDVIFMHFTGANSGSSDWANDSRVQYYHNTTTSVAHQTGVDTYPLYAQSTYNWEPVGWTLVTTGDPTTGMVSQTGATTTTVTPAVGVGDTNGVHYYAVYMRTAHLVYNGNGSTGGSTTSDSGDQYYSMGHSTQYLLGLTPKQNGFTKTGHTFSTWASGSVDGTQYAPGASGFWMPNTAWDSSDTHTMYAIWTPNNYEITLDKNGGTSNGTTKVYTTYNQNVYNDSDRLNPMTTSANPIATLPSKTYTISYDGNSGTVGTTTSSNTTSSAPVNGFFSTASGGTKYISADRHITADGVRDGKLVSNNTTKWYAQWGAQPAVTLPNATYANYTLRGWYTTAQTALTASGGTGTRRGAAGGTYVPSASETLYAAWARNCVSPGSHGSCTLTINSDGTATYTTSCETGYTISGAGTYNPTCTANTNTLTLNKNNGTGTIKNSEGTTYTGTTNGSISCTTGSNVPLPSWTSSASANNTTNITNGTGTASKVFLGWATSSTATTGSFSYTCGTASAQTLYAVWGSPTCDITDGDGTVATTVDNKPTCEVVCSTGYGTSGTYSGNAGETTYSYTCTDQTAPNITVMLGTTNILATTANRNPDFNASEYTLNPVITATDTGSGISRLEYAITTSASFPSTGFVDITSSNGTALAIVKPLGRYYIHVRAVDVAGNPSQVTTKWINVRYKIVYYDYVSGTSSSETTYFNSTTTSFTARTPDPKTGYTTTGWYDASGSNGTKVTDAGVPFTPTMSQKLYAHWQPNTYIIAYAGMAGATHGNSHPTSGTYDSVVTVNNPSKPGYTFTGWTLSGMDNVTHYHGATSTSLTEFTGETLSATTDAYFKNLLSTSGTVTFTATWAVNTNTLTLNKNNGTGIIKNDEGTTYTGTTNGSMFCTTGTFVTLPAWTSSASTNNTTNITNGTGTGAKVFLGWATSSTATTGSFNYACGTASSQTLYAVWGSTTCDIANGTGTVATSSENKPVCNVSCNNGYSRTGYLDTTTSGFTATGPAYQTTASHTCVARTYKVTLDPKRYESSSATTGVDPDTTGTTQYWYRYKTSPSTTPSTVCYYYTVALNSADDEIAANCVSGTPGDTITVPTMTGYTFGGYFVEKPGTGTQYVLGSGATTNQRWNNIASDGTLYAQWTAQTSTVLLKNGNTTVDTVTATFGANMPVKNTSNASLTMPTKTKAVFTGYFDNVSAGNQYYTKGLTSYTTWDKTGDQSLYAHFDDCTCTPGSNVASCSATGVSSNKCQYTYTCNNGYHTGSTGTSQTGTFTATTAGVGANTSPACSLIDYTMRYSCGIGGTASDGQYTDTGTPAVTGASTVHYGDSKTMGAVGTCHREFVSSSNSADNCSDCFNFNGWSIDAESTALEDFILHNVGTNVSPWGNTDNTDWCIIDNTSEACSAFAATDFYVVANYTPKQYDITYMYSTGPANNNPHMPDSYTYTRGDTIRNADQTAPAHATFNGWCNQPNGGGTCWGAGTDIEIRERDHDDMMLYAQWECDAGYVLSYDSNNQPVCTAGTGITYNVCHYTKNLGDAAYTLHGGACVTKTGTADATVPFSSEVIDITGFTYDEGFATSPTTNGTTKPSSGAVTSTTILGNGTRVIDLYYDRNTYTITVNAGDGIASVAGDSGWTVNQAGTSMTKSFAYESAITLDTAVVPTHKNGYSGVAYTKSGTGTLNSTTNTFTVGAGAGTITVAATTLAAPTNVVVNGGTTKTFNYQSTNLVAVQETSYDNGVTLYYKFGNTATTTDTTAPDCASGTYSWPDSSVTSATKTIAKDAYLGYQCHKVKVYAVGDGGMTSDTVESSGAATLRLMHRRVGFNVVSNGGTRIGSTYVYVKYGSADTYDGYHTAGARAVPTATKNGYTFTGWWTTASDGDLVYDTNGVLQQSVSGYTNGSAQWVINSNKNVYAQFAPITYNITYDLNDISASADPSHTGTKPATYTIETPEFTISNPTMPGYTFTGWTVTTEPTGWGTGSSTSGNADFTVGMGTYGNIAFKANWTANTNTTYKVYHYTKNLTGNSYTLNGTYDSLTGTSDATVQLESLARTISGFTYDAGFETDTTTNGTTKPSSGAVTSTTILADGTRVIDLYYDRNTYTITVNAGNGIASVAGDSGWTVNQAGTSMSKSFSYETPISLGTVVTPTHKNGYTGTGYSATGAGSLSGATFTVGAGAGTITVAATGIAAPTGVTLTISDTEKTYNKSATTLTAGQTRTYDNDIHVYYKFGNTETFTTGNCPRDYTYQVNGGETSTKSIGAAAYLGKQCHKVGVYATDGTLTSGLEYSESVQLHLLNRQVTFNVGNGETLVGTATGYAQYNNSGLYSGRYEDTTWIVAPLATKTGHDFQGWYTTSTEGSQVYNARTALQGGVQGYTNNSAQWILDADTNLYARFQLRQITCPATQYLPAGGESASDCTLCIAGYYCPGGTFWYDANNDQGLTICPAGSFCVAGVSAPTACVIGSYTATTGQSACLPCQDGLTTSAAGRTSCNANCANRNSGVHSWSLASWNTDNTMSNLCTITACRTHFYPSVNNSGNACSACTSFADGLYPRTEGPTLVSAVSSTFGGDGRRACFLYRREINGSHIAANFDLSATQCAAGTYSYYDQESTIQTFFGQSYDCDTCPVDTYSGVGATSCTNCLPGYITNDQGSGSASDCHIYCDGGYYLAHANDTSCDPVGPGHWAPGAWVVQGQTSTYSNCPTGMTTIGYGPGADEVGDCGRKLHVGDDILYLRSLKKTTPSLNVMVENTQLYGNMSVTPLNMSANVEHMLRLPYEGDILSIHDDSAEGYLDVERMRGLMGESSPTGMEEGSVSYFGADNSHGEIGETDYGAWYVDFGSGAKAAATTTRVRGTSTCSTLDPKSDGAFVTAYDQTKVQKEYEVNQKLAPKEKPVGSYCYCRVTNANAPDVQWVFAKSAKGEEDCGYGCASACSQKTREDYSFRDVLFRLGAVYASKLTAADLEKLITTPGVEGAFWDLDADKPQQSEHITPEHHGDWGVAYEYEKDVVKVSGISTCSTLDSGEFKIAQDGGLVELEYQMNMRKVPNKEPVGPVCYCKVTDPNLSGLQWVQLMVNKNAPECAASCANGCAEYAHGYTGFKSVLFTPQSNNGSGLSETDLKNLIAEKAIGGTSRDVFKGDVSSSGEGVSPAKDFGDWGVAFDYNKKPVQVNGISACGTDLDQKLLAPVTDDKAIDKIEEDYQQQMKVAPSDKVGSVCYCKVTDPDLVGLPWVPFKKFDTGESCASDCSVRCAERVAGNKESERAVLFTPTNGSVNSLTQEDLSKLIDEKRQGITYKSLDGKYNDTGGDKVLTPAKNFGDWGTSYEYNKELVQINGVSACAGFSNGVGSVDTDGKVQEEYDAQMKIAPTNNAGKVCWCKLTDPVVPNTYWVEKNNKFESGENCATGCSKECADSADGMPYEWKAKLFGLSTSGLTQGDLAKLVGTSVDGRTFKALDGGSGNNGNIVSGAKDYGDWGATFSYNDKLVQVNGISACSQYNAKDYGATDDSGQVQSDYQSNMSAAPTKTPVGGACWCKLTDPYTSGAKWTFLDDHGTEDCSRKCANLCMQKVDDWSWGQILFGLKN